MVLLGHGGAGKTTAAEALALVTGVTKRMGKVTDGNTISDYDKEEIKRQFSISTSLIPLEYNGEDGPIKILSLIHISSVEGVTQRRSAVRTRS